MNIIISYLTTIAIITGGGYWYYTSSQSKIEELILSNAMLIDANEHNSRIIKLKQAEYDKTINLVHQLSSKLERANTDKNQLTKLLRKHNLTELAAKKPGLIEKRINNASDKLVADITSFTTN